MQEHESLDVSLLVPIAIKMIDRVLDDGSELRELWQESEDERERLQHPDQPSVVHGDADAFGVRIASLPRQRGFNASSAAKSRTPAPRAIPRSFQCNGPKRNSLSRD